MALLLFLTFHSQEERREYGGSAFIEMQFCKLPVETGIKDIVAVRNINNWQNDSLYIYDDNVFYKEYSPIFNGGIYNNLKSGIVDVYGINYYAPVLIDSIFEKLHRKKPVDYEVVSDWIEKAQKYNGFYILGL